MYVEYYTQGYIASKDDGSCSTTAVLGCTDADYLEYYGFVGVTIPVDISEYVAALNPDQINNVDDGSCSVLVNLGCYNSLATNNNPSATVYDPSICEGAVGCTIDTFLEYNSEAIIDNGSCLTPIVRGCDIDTMFNYNPAVNVPDDSCYPVVEGCLDEAYYNYNDYDYDGHPNELSTIGGTDINTNKADDCIAFVYGCTDNGLSPNGANSINDVSSDQAVAFNYDPNANSDDGSCYPVVYGCLNSIAYNFNDFDGDGIGNYVTGIDGVDVNTEYEISNCIIRVYGCINDSTAYNYNDYDYDGEKNPLTGENGVDVNTDDGSCYPVVEGCLDTYAYNYNDYDNDGESNTLTNLVGIDVNTHDLSLCKHEGCTNSTASNYDSYGMIETSFGDLVPATIDDGSCEYPCSVGEEYLPQPFTGNTGANMTVMMTYDFISSLPISNHGTYLVATDPNGLIVGSEVVSGVGQTAMAVWGDDTFTSEIDGASANASISFQLVDGDKLYDVEMPSPVIYTYFGFVAQMSSASIVQNCGPLTGCTDVTACNYDPEAVVDDNSCQYPGCVNSHYIEYYSQGYTAACDDGSCAIEVEGLDLTVPHFKTPLFTGNNMTIGFNLPKYSGFDSATIAAFYDLNGDGIINTETYQNDDGQTYSECVGSTAFENEFFSLSLWGDDSSTDQVDGIVGGAKDVIFAIKTSTGEIIALDLIPEFLGFTSNGIIVVDQINLDVTVYGCTDVNYCNYDPDADENDGSCSGYYGCTDSHYVQ
ncbi:hypothetical protein N9V23_04110, partial [Flavobacteriales bacterium]|nr:hypothetical protein [Flavobacteriales bacterium]